jgi:hypothetical protein
MDPQMHTGFRGPQFAHSNKGNGASVVPTADWVVRSAVNSTRDRSTILHGRAVI